MTLRIADVASLVTDGTHYTPAHVDIGVPFVSVKDMSSRGLDLAGAPKISMQDFVVARNGNSAPQRNDVLLSKDGTVGKVHVVGDEGEFAVLSSIAIIRPRTDLIDPSYLGWFLRSPSFLAGAEKSKTGSAVRRIILADVKRQPVRVPPLPEQRRIAAILDEADALRVRGKEQRAVRGRLAAAIFDERFTSRHKESARMVPLGEVASRVTDGTHQSPDWVESGVPFIFVSNITSGEIRFETSKFVSVETYERLTKHAPIEQGDVLYSAVGSYGVPAVVRSGAPFLFQRHIAHIKPHRHIVNSDFLAVAMASERFKSQADRVARGAAQKTVTLSDLSKLLIPLPPLEDQVRFARDVVAQGEWGAIASGREQRLEELFASLQYRAFRGEL